MARPILLRIVIIETETVSIVSIQINIALNRYFSVKSVCYPVIYPKQLLKSMTVKFVKAKRVLRLLSCVPILGCGVYAIGASADGHNTRAQSMTPHSVSAVWC